LAELVDINDREEIVERLQRLLRDVPYDDRGAAPRARILRVALLLAPRLVDDFGRAILDQVIPTYDSLPEARNMIELGQQSKLLEKALFLASHYEQLEHIRILFSRIQALMLVQREGQWISAMEGVLGQCVRSLRKLGITEEIDRFLSQTANAVLQGQDIQSLKVKRLSNCWASLGTLLHVAEGWFYFGHIKQAE
jgi:hypothetical protein